MANGYIPAAVERGCDPCSQVKVESKAFLGGVLGIDVNGERQPISEGGIVDLTFIEEETREAAEQAIASAQAAAESEQTASEAAASARSSESAAQTAANAAEAAKDDAEDAASSANASKNTADSYATAAQTAAAAAQVADGNAERSAESAIAAAAQAASSAGAAQQYANEAYTSASTAQTASGAAQDAQTAAEASASTASSAATTATQAATASQAAQSSAEAAQSAAASSATAASGSATAAAGSATQAAASATAADASATAAAQSAATLTLDATLTSATQAAQAKAVGDALTNLNSAFDIEEHKSLNLLDPDEVGQGYYWTDGFHTSTSYVYTGLMELEQGKHYTMQIGTSGIAVNRSISTVRFIVYYGEDGTTVTGSATSTTDITLPNASSKYVRCSLNYASVSAFIAAKPSFVEGTTILDYIEYFAPYTTKILKAECNNDSHIQSIVNQTIANESGKLIFTATSDSLSANTNLICCDYCCNKKNEYIELTANFDSFGELTIAHGKDAFMGMYITITASKLQIYNYNGTLSEEFDHGLTLSDFINVIIYTKNDSTCRSSITIMTAGGDYSVETTRYYSCRSAVLCNATFSMTNAKMQYVVNDGKEPVWVFGDSYISLGDPNRWATQLVLGGHKHLLLCGYGGAMSQNQIVDFRLMLTVAKPKYIVWALGMNDGDSSSAVNANWKTYVDEVLQTCEETGVTPILATIPNCPNIINTYKNAYVKSLGCRYVDFAKAVNAESAGATWYAGMLSSDNTHPSALGAKALMRQFLLDVPEVLYAEE